uniref:Cytochrome P450 n=1 Tax=Cannabis sativa TaxID=3483 RepID=A0A803P3G5_CANSA
MELKRHYKNLPPTPPSLPIIGHLHLVKPPLHRALRNLSTKYGDVFSLRFGFRQVVVVSSPSVVEECFTKNDVVLANRPQLLAAKHIGYNSTNMVDTPYGDHWRNLRRIGATEIFSSGRLNLFVGIRRDEVKRLLFKLSHHKDWQKVELKSMLQELLYNILMRMVAGKRCDNNDMVNKEEARRYRDTLRVALGLAGAGNSADFLPFLNWIPNSFEKKVKKVGKKLDSLVEGLIKEHRSSRDKNRNTIIEHLLSLQESQPEYYTDQIIKGFVLPPPSPLPLPYLLHFISWLQEPEIPPLPPPLSVKLLPFHLLSNVHHGQDPSSTAATNSDVAPPPHENSISDPHGASPFMCDPVKHCLGVVCLASLGSHLGIWVTVFTSG